MPTLSLLDQVTVDNNGYRQPISETLDLDGYREFSLYVNGQALTFGGGGTILRVEVLHAARNRDSDFKVLATIDLTSAAPQSLTYVTQFSRYIWVKIKFVTSDASNSGAVELLVVPKAG